MEEGQYSSDLFLRLSLSWVGWPQTIKMFKCQSKAPGIENPIGQSQI
uniref:Uncharacterized protein n=1 Tax=Rhizophora mucronata TaxID=61149 RepID=A0A2P2QU41_RHIMU